MDEKKLLIIAPDAGAAASDLIGRVMAAWQQDDAPEIICRTLEEILERGTIDKEIALAWVLTQTAQPPRLYQVIEVIQECHIPTMLTRPMEQKSIGSTFQDGVVIAPPEADAQTLCTMLRTLHSQTGDIAALRTEINVLRAHHGGLCGQIQTLDEELRLASQLQCEFLPRELPELGGVSFRAMFRPAGYVSGDIYDVQRVDEEHIAFFIADAVGHGVPAALLTMYIKSALHVKEVVPGSASRYEIVPPDKVLERLNKNMCRQEGGKVRFATACFGIINCKTLKTTLARAGHPLPMLFRANDDFEELNPEGPLLGVFPEAEFDTLDVQLEPGDRMLLYSDGFELAFDKKQGLEYEDRLKELAHGTMDQAIAGMSKLLDRQAGSLHQEDDLTLLLMGADEPVEVETEESSGVRQRKTKPKTTASKQSA